MLKDGKVGLTAYSSLKNTATCRKVVGIQNNNFIYNRYLYKMYRYINATLIGLVYFIILQNKKY